MSRRVVIAAALATALVASAPAGAAGGGAPKQGKTRQVDVQSDFYAPGRMTVHVGDRIKWVWQPSGFELHDVSVDSGPTRFHSPTQAAGSFTYRFRKAGTYKLYCTQHEEDMTMTLTVRKKP